MNPNVSEKVIQHELESDPDGASAEWLAKFRDDLESAFSLEAIQACVIPGREELPSSPAIAYRAFVDPSVVVQEASESVRGYGVASVVGDNYATEWPVEAFRLNGIAYERAAKNKSKLYLALIHAVNGKQIELLDHRKLIEELRRLQRRRSRTGL